VNNQVLVGVLHAGAHLAEQVEPFVGRQALIVAVAIDRHAVYEFHHEERLPVGGRSAVHQTRDVGVIEGRHCLAFELEAGDDLR
jgi:hypothetical protein